MSRRTHTGLRFCQKKKHRNSPLVQTWQTYKMKVGDLVVYAWNAKERPEEVQVAIVLDTDPSLKWPGTDEEYIQIQLQCSPQAKLVVPRFKLDLVSEHDGEE